MLKGDWSWITQLPRKSIYIFIEIMVFKADNEFTYRLLIFSISNWDSLEQIASSILFHCFACSLSTCFVIYHFESLFKFGFFRRGNNDPIAPKAYSYQFICFVFEPITFYPFESIQLRILVVFPEFTD